MEIGLVIPSYRIFIDEAVIIGLGDFFFKLKEDIIITEQSAVNIFKFFIITKVKKV